MKKRKELAGMQVPTFPTALFSPLPLEDGQSQENKDKAKEEEVEQFTVTSIIYNLLDVKQSNNKQSTKEMTRARLMQQNAKLLATEFNGIKRLIEISLKVLRRWNSAPIVAPNQQNPEGETTKLNNEYLLNDLLFIYSIFDFHTTGIFTRRWIQIDYNEITNLSVNCTILSCLVYNRYLQSFIPPIDVSLINAIDRKYFECCFKLVRLFGCSSLSYNLQAIVTYLIFNHLHQFPFLQLQSIVNESQIMYNPLSLLFFITFFSYFIFLPKFLLISKSPLGGYIKCLFLSTFLPVK